MIEMQEHGLYLRPVYNKAKGSTCETLARSPAAQAAISAWASPGTADRTAHRITKWDLCKTRKEEMTCHFLFYQKAYISEGILVLKTSVVFITMFLAEINSSRVIQGTPYYIQAI